MVTGAVHHSHSQQSSGTTSPAAISSSTWSPAMLSLVFYGCFVVRNRFRITGWLVYRITVAESSGSAGNTVSIRATVAPGLGTNVVEDALLGRSRTDDTAAFGRQIT
uniref:Uncharacterized protein n=1 Tax=Anopheles atroparvus TaxID=41427 RepID=A0A182IUH3_ANOAO